MTHVFESRTMNHVLEGLAVLARERARDEMLDIPMYMKEFAARLLACGVGRDDVRNMSRERLTAVVGAIKEFEAKRWRILL